MEQLEPFARKISSASSGQGVPSALSARTRQWILDQGLDSERILAFARQTAHVDDTLLCSVGDSAPNGFTWISFDDTEEIISFLNQRYQEHQLAFGSQQRLAKRLLTAEVCRHLRLQSSLAVALRSRSGLEAIAVAYVESQPYLRTEDSGAEPLIWIEQIACRGSSREGIIFILLRAIAEWSADVAAALGRVPVIGASVRPQTSGRLTFRFMSSLQRALDKRGLPVEFRLKLESDAVDECVQAQFLVPQTNS